MTNARLLDAETAAFIQRSVSINIAARHPGGRPAVSRAYGCVLSADRRQVVLFVPREQAAAVLEGIAANGVVAAVFSRPTSHRTLQLKGTDGRIEPCCADDRQQVTAYLESLGAELRQLGHDTPFIASLLAAAEQTLLRACFTPSAAFEQTPGVNAGRPLKP